MQRAAVAGNKFTEVKQISLQSGKIEIGKGLVKTY